MNPSERPVVVVVGSLHYDIMIDAPDRPRKGETVTGHAWRPKFGGKGGNQAVASAKAGARVRMAGAVGDDDFGQFLFATLKGGGVDVSCIARLPGTGSGMSVAISDAEGDYGAVIVSGANLRIDPAGLANRDLWENAKALVLQNEVPDAVNLAAARAAKTAGALVCLNAAPYRPLPDELAKFIDVLIVNAIEAEDFSGSPVPDLAAAAAVAEKLSERFRVVVVTAGGSGVAGVRRNEPAHALKALPVHLVSTHGAGDVFVGAFVTALAASTPLARCLELANEAAAWHVSNAHSEHEAGRGAS